MANIKWSAFPSTTATTVGDALVGLQSGGNERFLVSTTPSASGIALWDANTNISADNVLEGYTTTATAAGTTTLTVSSMKQQFFTGVTTQTVVLPVTSTLVLGQSFEITNNSTALVTINSSGGNLIQTLGPNTRALVTCILISGTTAASWSGNYISLTSAAPNPNISITGTTLGSFLFSFYNTSSYQNNTFVPYLLSAVLLATTAESGITAINFGNVTNFGLISWTQTWTSLTGFTADNLISIEISWNPIFASLTSFSLPALLYCSQGFGPNCALLTSFSTPLLYSTGGSITVNFPVLTSLSFPALVNVGGNFAPVCALVTSFTAANLQTINLTFTPTFNILTSLSLPALVRVTTAFTPVAPLLTTLTLAALTTVGGAFNPTLAALTSLTLTALTTFGSSVAASFAALTTVSLPALLTVASTFTITASLLTTFSFNAGLLSVGGNVTMSGMALNVASVDGILVRLAALDGTGGTTAYSSKTVNVSGGTSATPGAAGLAAKVTLVARGCTVINN